MAPELPRERLEKRKTSLTNRATVAYSHDEISLEMFETYAREIENAEDSAALDRIDESLPVVREPEPAPEQNIRATASTVKKTGRWLESDEIALRAKMSTVVLDLTSYTDESDLALHIDCELDMSKLKLIVPEGIEVRDRLSDQQMGNFVHRGRSIGNAGTLVLTGTARMSSIKVKTRRVRRRG